MMLEKTLHKLKKIHSKLGESIYTILIDRFRKKMLKKIAGKKDNKDYKNQNMTISYNILGEKKSWKRKQHIMNCIGFLRQ